MKKTELFGEDVKLKDFSEYGVTQKIMSDLARVNPSTINKIVTSGSFTPLDKNAHRNIRYSIDQTRKIISRFISDERIINKKVLAFYNFKGGVGKTSICFEISTHLALMGFNVLVIDADAQAHLSTALSFDTSQDYPTMFDVIVRDLPHREAIKSVFPGLDCLPSNLSLSRLEPEIDQLPRREERVSIAFENLKEKYDFIIFDANPTISRLNMNIVNFSDLLCIVVETQLFSINGLKMLMVDLEKFCKSMLIEVPEILIIPNKYEERTASSGEAMALLRRYYASYVIPDFAIRKSEEIHTSCKLCLPLATFCRSNSIALEDINDVLHHLINLCTKKESAAADLIVA